MFCYLLDMSAFAFAKEFPQIALPSSLEPLGPKGIPRLLLQRSSLLERACPCVYNLYNVLWMSQKFRLGAFFLCNQRPQALTSSSISAFRPFDHSEAIRL